MYVVLQAGHCFRRRGSTGTAGEQDYNIAVCREAERRFRILGVRCEIILADDPVPRSDVFVAVHGDGSTNPRAQGCSVGYRNRSSGIIANQWKRAYIEMGFEGGARADNYTNGLRYYYGTGRAHRAGTPIAWIIEGGFLTNPIDRAFMQTSQGHDAAAQAIVSAVMGENVKRPQEDESMKKGERGGQVTVLQWNINEYRVGVPDPHSRAEREPGYTVPDGAIRVDGVYGDITEGAVKEVQAGWGYTATGVADAAFQVRLERSRSERAIRHVLTKLAERGDVGVSEGDVKALVDAAIEEIAERLDGDD